MRAVREPDETFRSNHARGQRVCEKFEAIARENFWGTECERLKLRLMPMFRARDFCLASNSKQQFRINPAPFGANNYRGRIDFPQLRFKRLDLCRPDKVDLVQ